MSTPYIPAADAAFQAWAQNFSATIAASPSTYGLASSDAASITSSYNNWHAAYLLASTPATRTSPTIAAKDVQKASSLIVMRTYAQQIQANAGVSNMAKSAAGLTVRATGRTPIAAPNTIPILGLVSHQPGITNCSYSDSATPTTKAKPFGAIQMELWAFTAQTGTPSAAAATFVGLITTSPFVYETPSGDVGNTITLYGRWNTRRGLVGPWSAGLTITAT